MEGSAQVAGGNVAVHETVEPGHRPEASGAAIVAGDCLSSEVL